MIRTMAVDRAAVAGNEGQELRLKALSMVTVVALSKGPKLKLETVRQRRFAASLSSGYSLARLRRARWTDEEIAAMCIRVIRAT